MFSQSSMGPMTGDIDSMSTLHLAMKFMLYNHRTLSALRCVSKPYRSAVQSPKSPWANCEEVMISKYGQCIIFNAREDESGQANFSLKSVSPVGRKFVNSCAKLLNRYHHRVSNGLTKLVLHHALIDEAFFETLGALTNLAELELVLCRGITSIKEASRLPSLEILTVNLCPLEANGVDGLLLPKLRKLTFQSCYRLSNLNDADLRTASNLEVLTVENCGVFDDTANLFLAALSPSLHTLNLNSTHMDSAIIDIPMEVREHSLTSLSLVGTPLTFETLRVVAPTLSKLKSLSLSSCEELETYESVGQMPSLQFLDVSSAAHGEGLEMVANCAALELFRMSYSKLENIMFLSSLLSLRVLDAPNSSLTDTSLMFLEGLPSLDTVVLTESVLITNINVLRTCPQLRRAFCGKTSITDEGIVLLMECMELEELDLSFTCVRSVNHLIGCPNLRVVNVCRSVPSEDGVKALLLSEKVHVICDTFDADGEFDEDLKYA